MFGLFRKKDSHTNKKQEVADTFTPSPTAVHSKRAAYVILLIALVAGALFARDYLGVFALAALVAALFAPLHDWFVARRGTKKFATFLTITVIIMAVIIPVSLVIMMSLYDAAKLFTQAQQSGWLDPAHLKSLADGLTSGLTKIPGVDISQDSVRNAITNVVQKVGPAIVNFFVSATGNIVDFFIKGIVFLMLLAVLLARKADLMQAVRHMSPFDDAIDDEYLRNTRSMAVAMVKGTLAIAVVVGAIATFTYWIIGIPYLSFWFVLFTFLSFVPLGAGLVFIPSGILLILLGQTWQGVLVLLVQFIIINNVDNVLRPVLAPKETNLPAVLLLVGAFAGVSFFGMLGVIYGPIIMILLYTTFSLYDRHRVSGIPLK